MSKLLAFIRKRMKGYQKIVSNKFHQITWRQRSLPNFIIIGAQKSGTSSLFYYLSQHPQLIPSNKKEIHYFDSGLTTGIDQYQLGIRWYRAHFPLWFQLMNGQQTYEATPNYLFHPFAAQRIYQVIPSVKLIVLLRNPTDRAISQYLHRKRQGGEILSFREMLEQEDEQLRPIYENQDFDNTIFRSFSYKNRGLYKIQLSRYFSLFPRENIFILPSERFFENTRTSLQSIFHFIGIDSDYQVKDLKPRNVANNRMKIDLDIYDYLNDFFHPHNKELYELIGEDFSW